MKQSNQKVIYLHDSTCKGLHQVIGACFEDYVWKYSYVKFACWACGKDLGTLVTHRRQRNE